MASSQETVCLSLIVPTLNEERYIAAFLEQVSKVLEEYSRLESTEGERASFELLVCDGGSEDQTLEILKNYPEVSVCRSAAGRAVQMNTAANKASGELLWFLHADTQISLASLSFLLNELKKLPANTNVLGAFRFSLDIDAWRFRVLESLVHFRTSVCGMPYGDQGIFISKSLFDKIGGYPEQEILEDVELWRRASKETKPILRPERLITSGRFWHRAGLFKTTLINAGVMLAYYLGVSPGRIAKLRNARAAAGRRR